MFKKAPLGKSLYFVAIIPDAKTEALIGRFKQELQNRFDLRAALRSPAHITLQMPFRHKESKEKEIIDCLRKVAENHGPFEIACDGFGSFAPKSLFIKIVENQGLEDVQYTVTRAIRKKLNIIPKPNSRPFHAHITIAFRDLKKALFKTLWLEFEKKEFATSFYVDSLCLLKHNGASWEVCEKIYLKKDSS